MDGSAAAFLPHVPDAPASHEGNGGEESTLNDDLLAITSDDETPLPFDMVGALLELVNAPLPPAEADPAGQAQQQMGELLQYIVDVLHERLFQPSANVIGKTLVVLRTLCDQSPPFLAVAKTSEELIATAKELETWAAPEGAIADENILGMVHATATEVVLHLADVVEVEQSISGQGWVVKRAAVGRIRSAATNVGGIVSTRVEATSAVRSRVLGGVTTLGKGVKDKVEEAAEKKGLKRSNKLPEDGITKEQRLAATRLVDIVVKHGTAQVENCRKLAESGHQLMANVLMTMELLHIQREAAGERLQFCTDEQFQIVSDLFLEVSEIEAALRHHNSMKMCVYGVLNKQRNSGGIEFNKYVFAIEGGVVKNFIFGEREEEDSFELNYVYEINNKSLVKKSALERMATLGMGSSTLDGDQSEERKYSFKIGLLKAKSVEEKTQRQLMIDDLYSQQRTAIHEENFVVAEEIKGRIALLLAAEEAERAAEADDDGGADGSGCDDAEPEPEAEPDAPGVQEELPDPVPEDASQPEPDAAGTKGKGGRWKDGLKAKASKATKLAKEKGAAGVSKAYKEGSQAGKLATAAASKRAAATAAKAQAIAKGASDAAKNAETVDMLECLGGEVPNGVGDLAELTIADSIVCAAPDGFSADMWKQSLLPFAKSHGLNLRYRLRQLPPLKTEKKAIEDERIDYSLNAEEAASFALQRKDEGDGGGGAADSDIAATEITEPVLGEWTECFCVMYKTVLMVFNREGGMRLENVPLWRIRPSTVVPCSADEAKELAVTNIGASFAIKTSTEQYFFEAQEATGELAAAGTAAAAAAQAAADAWVGKLMTLLLKRSDDMAATEEFIAAEEMRLLELEEERKAAANAGLGRLKNKISDTVGGDGLATGVVVGVSGIISGAASGVRKDGTRGLVKGVAKGVGSLGQSTVVNLVGVVKNTAEGVATNVAPSLALSISNGVEGAVGNLKKGALHRGEAAGIKKELGQESAAQRTFQIVMRHGVETIRNALDDAEAGHEVMASVRLTLEMLHIQQISAEDKMVFLDNESFQSLSDLYDEIARMEATLRTHNTMKMAVFGILNKQKSNVTALNFQKYVFSMENGVVRYYMLDGVAKGEEEGSFSVMNVYAIDDTTVIKRSKLESVLTLGMGTSEVREGGDEDKRFPFIVKVLTKRDTNTPNSKQRAGETHLREELDQLALHELVARLGDPAKSGRVGDLSPAQLIDLVVEKELGQDDPGVSKTAQGAVFANGALTPASKKLSLKEKAKQKRKQLAEGVPSQPPGASGSALGAVDENEREEEPRTPRGSGPTAGGELAPLVATDSAEAAADSGEKPFLSPASEMHLKNQEAAAAEVTADKSTEKVASKALGLGRKTLRRASVVASSTVSSTVGGRLEQLEQREYKENDLRHIIRQKLVIGRSNIEFMVSNSLVLSAPDQKSMDMWKVALQPVLSPCYMKYRTRRPLSQPEPEPRSSTSSTVSVSAAAPAAAASEAGTKAAPPAVEDKGQDVTEPAVQPDEEKDEDKVLLRRFYDEHPAGREASSSWDGVDSWGEAEWELKLGKIIATYTKKAAKAAEAGKTGADASMRGLMYAQYIAQYGVDPRTLTPLSDDEADDEDQEGGNAAAEEGVAPASAISEWKTLYAVLYKTQLMLCNEEGGDVQHSLALWTVFPTSVEICFDPAIGGAAVIKCSTSDGVEHFFDCQKSELASAWMAALRDLQNQRGDAELVDKFIQFERKRLAKRAADKLASEKGLARLRAVSELASGIGEGEVRWVGDGVRKGVVGLGGNVLSGLNTTRHLAYTGLKKDGTSGLVSGLAKGVGNLGQGVVVGVAGLASNVVEGVAATADVVIEQAADTALVAGSAAATAGTVAANAAGSAAATAKDKASLASTTMKPTSISPKNWWQQSEEVQTSRMAVVTKAFDPEHAKWSAAVAQASSGALGPVEVYVGQAVKLLQDAEDQPFWTVEVEGKRGFVPRECLLSTSGPRKGAWGDLA